MERTGHFSADSLARQVEYAIPKFSLLSGRGIAEIYYDKLKRETTKPITKSEFVEIVKQESTAGSAIVWYLKHHEQRLKRAAKRVEQNNEANEETVVKETDNAS